MKAHILRAAAVGLLLASPLAAQDASMFRGNLAHTGVYPGAGPAAVDSVKWKVATGAYVISSPAVVGNVVYIGSTNGKLYALDTATGAERWTYRAGARIASSPAVANGLAYFLAYDDTLYALEAATGKARWKFATRGERRFVGTYLHGTLPRAEPQPDMYDVYLSSPAVWQGTVYVGSGDGHVYAVDAKTGALRWQFKTGDVVHSSPAVVDGTVFIGGWDTYFYALDAQTGALRWKFQTGNDTVIHNQIGIASSPAVVDGVVYFGCRDDFLYAVDAATGKEKWRVGNRGSWVISSPAVFGGKVYYGNSDGSSFFEVDAATGKVSYSRKVSWYFFSSPAVAGGEAYIGSWDGRLYAIDLATHRTSVFETDAPRRNRPKYSKPDGTADFRAAFGNGGESFYDQHRVAAANQWTMGSFLSSPVVVGGVVYVGSMDGEHLRARRAAVKPCPPGLRSWRRRFGRRARPAIGPTVPASSGALIPGPPPGPPRPADRTSRASPR